MAGGGIVSDPEKEKNKYGGHYVDTPDGEKLLFFGKDGPKLLDPGSGATADAGGVLRGALGGLVPGGGFVAEGIKNVSDARSRGTSPPPIQTAPAEPPPEKAGALDTAKQAAVRGIVGALPGGGLLNAATTEDAPRRPAPTQDASAQQAAPTPQPTSQAGPPAASPTPQVGPLGYSMEAVDAAGRKIVGPAYMTPEGIKVLQRGSAGSPGGLTGLGKQTLEKMTETERTVAEARQLEDTAREEGALAARIAAQQQAAYQDEAEVQAFARAQEIDTDIKEMERKLKDKDIAHAQAETAFTESRVDPDRYMRGNWLATLGMAFGAFSAGLGKTPNFAQEFVQARIAQDIRAQETAIELKGKHADNALADLKRQFGSLEEAKSAYEQFMTKASAAKFQALALRATDATEKAKNEEIAAGLMGKYALLDQDRKIRNQEKIWGERMYYRQGTAGTTGGFVVPTQESHSKAGEAWRQDEELNIARQKAAAERAKEAAAGPGEKLTEKEKTYEQIASSVYEKTVKLVQDHGGKVVDGKIVGSLSLPLDLVPGVDDKETGNVKARVTELGSMAANMNNAGAEAGQPTKDAMTPKLGMVTNSGAEGQLQAILSGSYDAIRNIDAKRKKEAERAKAAK
jgi:hypothetical protein